jgi:hypothetical protein
MLEAFKLLHKDYEQARNISLSEPEFAMLLCLVPVLIVGSSDYSLDRAEHDYMDQTVDEFVQRIAGAKPDRQAELRKLFYKELEYLLVQMAAWERRVLAVLEAYLKEFPEMKEHVRNRMVGIASISKGVNAYEQKRLMELCFKLNIALA